MTNKKKLPFVSILVPTTANRKAFLPQLFRCIVRQDYEGEKEIIILNDVDNESINIPKNINFRLINCKFKSTLGYKRNLLNNEAQGDILIYFDDDDYHMPTRINHTVQSLINGKNLIAGSSRSFVFRISNQSIYEYGPYGKYHSGCGSMGFFKQYIQNHNFDEEKNYAEESSFTNNFNEPMNQLDPEKTTLIIHHKLNTFNKNLSDKQNLSTYQKEHFIKYDEDLKFYENLK